MSAIYYSNKCYTCECPRSYNKFRIYNYFRKIFKFRDFMSTSRNFAKSVFAHIFSKFKCFAKQFILTKMTHNIFILQKFEIFSNSHSGAIAESFRENCS